ncbi:MAG: cytochrome c [Vicinamibacterales bacterium]
MRRVGAALLCAGVIGSACGQEPPPTLEMGRDLYTVTGCASCHGREGHGDGPSAAQLKSAPRDFRDVSAFKNGRTVEDIALTVANGLFRNGSQMPGFSHLTDQERKSLALYVLSLGDTPAAGATAGAEGKQ